MILVAQFESFLDPLLILLAVPTGLTGVLLILFATATTLNVMSLMGVVMMVGIVVSNSILIVEFTRQLLQKHRVDAAAFKAIQQRFGNDGLIQLTGAIGYYSMLAMTVNACELEAGPGADVLKV